MTELEEESRIDRLELNLRISDLVAQLTERPAIRYPLLPGTPPIYLNAAKVERHFEKFEAKNFREQTGGLLSDYENSGDTLVEWTRQAGIYAGTYSGFNSLTILYAQVLGNTESINITITNYEAQFSEAGAITTMHLLNLGQGKLIGEFTMEIDVSMDWIFDEEGSRWLITGETWEFVVFKTEVIAEGTVFPLHWQKRGDFSIWDEGMRQLFPSP